MRSTLSNLQQHASRCPCGEVEVSRTTLECLIDTESDAVAASATATAMVAVAPHGGQSTGRRAWRVRQASSGRYARWEIFSTIAVGASEQRMYAYLPRIM